MCNTAEAAAGVGVNELGGGVSSPSGRLVCDSSLPGDEASAADNNRLNGHVTVDDCGNHRPQLTSISKGQRTCALFFLTYLLHYYFLSNDLLCLQAGGC